MESNKQRKTQKREYSEQRQEYYKNLRKQQKKKRKERANLSEGELKRGQATTRSRRSLVIDLPKEPSKKRRLGDSEQNLPRGKRMVSASLQKNQGKKEKEVIQRPAAPKATEGTTFKELAPENLVRDQGARSIGSGTFGDCYPGKYRGISVMIEEYKEKRDFSFSFLQREARHEAQVLQQLGDHPGIPLLFGVVLKKKPVSLVLKYHGDGGESLTVYKAAKNCSVSEQKDWNRILHDTEVASDHIHKCGFTHNDLKCNNVVLEKREDQLLHPVIVDFGKSVAFTKTKIAVPKPSHLKGHYKNSYIATELVDGTGKPSIESDVYSLTYIINKVYGLLKFKTMPCIKKGLSEVATNRPSIIEITSSLRAAF